MNIVPLKYLCSCIVDHLLGCKIRLVANKQLVHILTGITVDFVQPLLHVIEAFLICNIVHNLQNQPKNK